MGGEGVRWSESGRVGVGGEIDICIMRVKVT